MKFYHKPRYKKNYFEGWYFKHIKDDFNIAFIPSVSYVDGEANCYIQIITNTFSHTFTFPISDFTVDKYSLNIKINNNTFTKKGISLNLEDEYYQIHGNIEYQEFTPLKSNIMGFFYYIPLLECKHGVISMKHQISGRLSINETIYDFNDGIGYIETDYGSSFPINYTWFQCNDFNKDVAIMYSHATIPFLFFKFTGFICAVICDGKEYRFATYNFSKLQIVNRNKIILLHKKFKLKINFNIKDIQKLKAPKEGLMNETIYESMNGNCKVELFKGAIHITTALGKNASIEVN